MLSLSESESDYDDSREEPPRFEKVDISSALQNCRIFNNVPLDVDMCVKAMMDLLYLLYTGRAALNEDEATEVFFMSTKLMQSPNIKLRRLHYVLIKELAPLVEARYIASNSLKTDVSAPTSSDTIRRNALRTFFAALNSSMYHSMDRTILECLNSRNQELVNTALVTGLHIAAENIELAKKWTTQLTKMNGSEDGNTTNQASRTALLHTIRTNDRLSAQRLLDEAREGKVRAPLAMALIVKICEDQVFQIMEKTGSLAEASEFMKFITSMTHHHNEVVVIQACQAFCNLPMLSDSDVFSCVSVLSNRLSSSSNVSRLNTVMLLSKLARTHPQAVSPISAQLEAHINDSHSGVSTYAMIVLLLTGSEETVARLLSQLATGPTFKDIEDDFKVVIITVTLELHKKFPNTTEPISNFLFAALGDVQSPMVKLRIVDNMISLSKTNPGSKESILTKLADCIDDCDFPAMTKRVLAHLSEEVPQCEAPRRYIRYIYNHCKLEQADIRAVAVRTLAKIAAKLPNLSSFIVPLLMRCCVDEDDEVRDRAVFYTKLFRTKDDRLIEKHITAIADQVSARRRTATLSISTGTPLSLTDSKVSGGGVVHAAGETPAASLHGMASSGGGSRPISSTLLEGRDALALLPPLRELGAPIKSCEPTQITESDNEYAVSVIKHLTPTDIILQFRIHNTMDGASFANVTVSCSTEELEVEPKFAIPVDVVGPGEVKYAYVVLGYEENAFPSGEVPCSITFAIREAGEEDTLVDHSNLEEFSMESFEMDVADFFRPLPLDNNFLEKWEAAAEEETAGTYELPSMRNLTVAVTEIAGFFGLHVLGGVPDKVTAASHTLNMSGTAVNSEASVVLMQAKVFISTSNAVVLQIAIRGGDENLREFLTNALLS